MVVNHLSFDSETAKRATWEAWEFTVVGPHLVEVTNASYGYQKDDHTYTVGVEERDGLALPAEYNCPADVHRKPDCKHKVALATVGGPTVLNAAVNFEIPSPASLNIETRTAQDKLQADGGAPRATLQREAETCPNGYSRCDGPKSEDLPCFGCYCEREEQATFSLGA